MKFINRNAKWILLFVIIAFSTCLTCMTKISADFKDRNIFLLPSVVLGVAFFTQLTARPFRKLMPKIEPKLIEGYQGNVKYDTIMLLTGGMIGGIAMTLVFWIQSKVPGDFLGFFGLLPLFLIPAILIRKEKLKKMDLLMLGISSCALIFNQLSKGVQLNLDNPDFSNATFFISIALLCLVSLTINYRSALFIPINNRRGVLEAQLPVAFAAWLVVILGYICSSLWTGNFDGLSRYEFLILFLRGFIMGLNTLLLNLVDLASGMVKSEFTTRLGSILGSTWLVWATNPSQIWLMGIAAVSYTVVYIISTQQKKEVL